MGKMFVIILMALLVPVLLLFSASAAKYNQGHYDEMQERIRGKGYKYCSYVMGGFLALYWIYDYCFPESFARLVGAVIAVIAIALGIIVFGVYSIMNNAYIYVGQNNKGITPTFAGIALLNLACMALHLDEPIIQIENGAVQYQSIFSPFFMFAIFASYTVAILIRRFFDRKQEGSVCEES